MRSRLDALVTRWRDDTAVLRRRGAQAQAEVLEGCAAELDAAMRDAESAVLTLQEAAIESGYSPDHLGRLIRQGSIPNAGRPNAPRIRQHDLPRKPSSSVAAGAAIPYDPVADARKLASRRRGGSDALP